MSTLPSSASLAVLARDAESLSRARALASDLGLPLLNAGDPREFSDCWLLQVSADGLAVGKGGRRAAGPVSVDYVGGKLGYRRQSQEATPDLVKAVGLRKGIRPRVWDLTAGLGQDAFVLARYGCSVTMVERNPVVHCLLADGLRRARLAAAGDPGLAEVLERLELLRDDSVDLLSRGTAVPADVIYIDTMFPQRSKSAKVKKGMQLFQEVVGEDPDADELLDLALRAGVKRVVVKRPRLAPALGDRRPALNFSGKSIRFDVYPLQKLD